MARMLPSTIPPGAATGSERRVFEMLERDLPGTWTCLHSLGISNHPRKAWAEIDFVLIGPPGIFCLEVKGGSVTRHGGVWTYTDGHGGSFTKTEGPWDQVAGAARALEKFLRSQPKRLPQVPLVGHGVVMTDVDFDESGPDLDLDTLLDSTTIAAGIRPPVERLAQVWESRDRVQRGRPPRALSDVERAALVGLLRGDFDIAPTLRARIDEAEREFVRLTRDQGEVMAQLSSNPRLIVQGGVGTGKTMLAIADTEQAAAGGARVLYVCFTKRLAARVRSELGGIAEAAHLHGLMLGLVERAGLMSRLPPPGTRWEEEHHQVDLPLAALEAIERGALDAPFDLLVVDEGQDLLHDNYLEVLDALVAGGLDGGRWRMFHDPQQNIFGAPAEDAAKRLLAGHPARCTLKTNCRNTREIAEATGRLSHLAVPESTTSGPAVEEIPFRDRASQRREATNAVGRLLSAHVRAEEIVVLDRHTLANSCLADGWARPLGSDLHEVADDGHTPIGSVGFSTIGGFKGLDAKAVVLLDSGGDGRDTDRFAYVGASRARTYLVVLLPAGLEGAVDSDNPADSAQ